MIISIMRMKKKMKKFEGIVESSSERAFRFDPGLDENETITVRGW